MAAVFKNNRVISKKHFLMTAKEYETTIELQLIH